MRRLMWGWVMLTMVGGCAHQEGVTRTDAVVGGGPRAPMPDPVITVLDSGAEPQQLLAYRLPVGLQTRQTLEMTMSMNMRIDDSQAFEMSIPPVRMVMALKVVARDPAGNHRLEFTFLTCEMEASESLPSEVMEPLRAELSGLEGASGTYVVSAYGAIRDFSFSPVGLQLSKQLLEQVETSMQKATASFPAVPVGEGATWEARVPLTTQGIEGVTLYRCHLDSLRGTQGTVLCTNTVEAPPQDLESDDFPKGTSARVLKMEATGQSALTFELDSLTTLLEGQGESSVRMKMTQAEGVEIKMDTDVKVGVSIYPTP